MKQISLFVAAPCCWLLTLFTPLHQLVCSDAIAAQLDIIGPTGSGTFGTQVVLLPNGNFVVSDPEFDEPGGSADVGAVHLYRPDGVLIYTLRGSSSSDQVGSGYITVLSNGHFVVTSPDWDNAGVFNAGAATWCNGASGSNSIVSASNSLVGSTASNRVGSLGVGALTNGNYVVISDEWDSSLVVDAGAATWRNGAGGSSGVVNASNSLVGSSENDHVGFGTFAALSNGNYVVSSRLWDDGAVADAGAATWGNGINGVSGVVSASNSLVGSAAGDAVGGSGVYPLNNGHYVVGSYQWDNGGVVDAGAVAWGNGVTGSTGALNAGNALVGSTAGDQLGGFVHALRNGNYVINSPDWDNGGMVDVGAVTWVNGATGGVGTLSIANSLLGSSANDSVGAISIMELSNDHYVVSSPFWDNGAVVDAGAVTWRNGNTSSSGLVSASNSLVGSSANDKVGNYGPCNYGGMALTNGHYVVRSSEWDNGGMADVGAVTWRNGSSGSGAVVSAGNSLIGGSALDHVGCGGVTALRNGHYVVSSPYWSNAAISSVGAATWRNGTDGSGATVGPGNSLIGSNANDRVGSGAGIGVIALTNGHYVVASPYWNNGATLDVGAVTWRNGNSASNGLISTANSLIGTNPFDYVGFGHFSPQGNGNFIASHVGWDLGAIVDAGAMTLGFANGGTTGAVTASNSVRGTVANAGNSMRYVYDALRAQLIVGRPASNIVSLLRPGAVTSVSIVLDTPDPSDPGEVVTFVTTLAASPAPSTGSVRIEASTGEVCTDNTPTITGANTAEFSCQIPFATLGARSVRAEFLGTNSHGYSLSGAEPHGVAAVFANGFE